MALLEIKNLSVAFATRNGPFKAVDGVDISVNPGEIVGIVGESGSGKSVAMLAVMGLLPWTATITADVMSFDGRGLAGMRPRSAAASSARYGDDLPGADEFAQPLFHGGLADQRGAQSA